MSYTRTLYTEAVLGSLTIVIIALLYLSSRTSLPRPPIPVHPQSSNAIVFQQSSVVLPTVKESARAFAINLINYTQLAIETMLLKKPPFLCPVVEVFNVTFPICLLPLRKDIYVSKSAQRAETYWEKKLIGTVMRLLHRLKSSSGGHERDVVFVDLGTNIGTYSLPILHNGFKVVSVDAQWEAVRRFTFSLYLGHWKDTGKITILNNAIGNETGTERNVVLDPREPTNAGASFVVPHGLCLTVDCNKTAVRTITLDDLLPFVKSAASTVSRRPQVVMKVDIQGSEPSVFTEATASKFFQETDVSAIQMEWVFSGSDAEELRRRKSLLAFFTSRGYSIRNAKSLKSYLTPTLCLDGGFLGDILLTKTGLDII